MSTPVITLNISPDRCCELPLPEDEKVSWPGLCRASAISSCTVLAGTDGCTTRTFETVPTMVTGAKSRTGS